MLPASDEGGSSRIDPLVVVYLMGAGIVALIVCGGAAMVMTMVVR